MLLGILIGIVVGTVAYFILNRKGSEVKNLISNDDLVLDDEFEAPVIKSSPTGSISAVELKSIDEVLSETDNAPASKPKFKKKKRYYGKPKPKNIV